MLCCFKNTQKFYHTLSLILNLACFTQYPVSESIHINTHRFILLLLLLYGILLHEFGKFHFLVSC